MTLTFEPRVLRNLQPNHFLIKKKMIATISGNPENKSGN